MTYELRLHIQIFRLMLKQYRKEARAIGALSRQMREQATALRQATHAETAEQVKCLLAAQPIATVANFPF
jgi:uncharacterized membrane protein